MTPDERRLDRLRRLERVRAIAKRQIAAETAQAEQALAQLRLLSERTRALSEDYATRSDAFDGYALRQTGRFAAGLCQMVSATSQEADTAQACADRRMQELAAAERRRSAVEDRLNIEQRQLAKRGASLPVGARRKTGTQFE